MTEPKNIKFLPQKQVYKYHDGINWGTDGNLYPRFMGDINGDGKADAIGFAHSSILVALSTGDGFTEELITNPHFSVTGGWSSQNTFPRVIADINGDGKADIVGFGDGSVWAMTSNGNSFNAPYKIMEKFTKSQSWSEQKYYPRAVADINGDGWADIVGFSSHGVYVSFAQKTLDGAEQVFFTEPLMVLAHFGTEAAVGSWESQEKYPRYLADLDGDGKADIVGFGAGNVYVAFSTGSSFEQPKAFSEYFTSNLGYSWNDLNQNGKSLYGRSIADINGDGKADIVGFGNWGTIVMTSNGRSFNPTYIANYEFSYSSWGIPNAQPRMLADVNGDGKADIVGFKTDVVHVSFVEAISPASLDIQACERFSPNIEVKCMEKVYNRAIKQFDESRMNAEAIQTAKKELIESYNNYANSVVHLQNSGTHFKDDTISAKEAKFIKTMDTAESSRLVEAARVAEAEEKAAEELKKAKEAEEEELRKLDEALSMDDSIYNQHEQDCQATQTNTFQDNQQNEATISGVGKIIYGVGEYVNG
jgi:hypothetical protein